MNKAILTLSLAILLLVTASCSDVVDEPQPVEYYQSLLDGKTKAEIKEILGPPDSEVVYGHGGGCWEWDDFTINSSTEKTADLRMSWDKRGDPRSVQDTFGPEYPLFPSK